MGSMNWKTPRLNPANKTLHEVLYFSCPVPLYSPTRKLSKMFLLFQVNRSLFLLLHTLIKYPFCNLLGKGPCFD